MINLYNYIKTLLTSKKGQSLIEYVLLIGLIGIFAMVALSEIGQQQFLKFNSLMANLKNS